MKKECFLLVIIILLMINSQLGFSQENNVLPIQWEDNLILPVHDGLKENLGLSGIIGGISNSVVLFGGGCNFPDAMPWYGGKKKYYNHVYAIFSHEKEKKVVCLQEQLPENIAYSACANIENGFVCVGGENEMGASDKVYMIQWNEIQQALSIKSLPSLPIKLTNASACAIGSKIYVVGGETSKGTSSLFLMLDINNDHPEWKYLPPIPVALSFTLAIAQSNQKDTAVYIIGGRTKTSSGHSQLHGSVYRFSFKDNEWQEKKGLHDEKGMPLNISAGFGLALDDDRILVSSGDDGKIFAELETLNIGIDTSSNATEKQSYFEKKLEIVTHHQGFPKKLWAYDCVKDDLNYYAPLPFAPVTTIAVKLGNELIVPCGEVKPGVRTDKIMIGNLLNR